MMWTDAASGKVTQTQRLGGPVSQFRNRFIRGGWGGGGGGFAARISSKIRPQDPGGGGGVSTRIAAPRGVVDMEVTSSSVSSVFGFPKGV